MIRHLSKICLFFTFRKLAIYIKLRYNDLMIMNDHGV